MNRYGLMNRICELKARAIKKGSRPIAVAVASIDALKLGCTHVNGLEIAKHPGLRHGQVILFEKDPETQDRLKPIPMGAK